jgi:hypothetical protein
MMPQARPESLNCPFAAGAKGPLTLARPKAHKLTLNRAVYPALVAAFDTDRLAQMAEPPKELSHPAPRALANIRGVRRQLVALFREGKAGLIDHQRLGKLIHALNVLQNMDNGRLFEERLLEVERRLGTIRPNGHDHTHTGARP